jgi:hypothetical protein
MKTALYSALVLLVLAVTGAVLVVTYDVHQDLAAARAVLGQASAAMAKVSLTADTLNGAATEERKNWEATSSEAAATGRALRMLISRVDRSFVDGTLYHINSQTLPAIDSQITQNGREMAATLKKAGETADSLTTATGSLNAGAQGFDANMQEIAKLLADPSIKDSFKQADGVLADTHAMTTAALPAVQRYASPPTRKQRILQDVKDFGAITYLGIRIALSF